MYWGWIFKSYLPVKIHDASIGIMGITLLFILPSKDRKDTILNWDDARDISWGTLLLFGGGISIAKALESSGIITILGEGPNRLQTPSNFGAPSAFSC